MSFRQRSPRRQIFGEFDGKLESSRNEFLSKTRRRPALFNFCSETFDQWRVNSLITFLAFKIDEIKSGAGPVGSSRSDSANIFRHLHNSGATPA
jgi:hypothetical protein